MARTIEAFAAKADPKPVSELSTIDGRLVFRTVYPSLAREQSCVNCHNQLQQGMQPWRLNDVMGAFAIDIPVASFLQDIRRQSYQLGLGLFAALAAVGLAIAVLHFRQTSEREVAAAELRTQNMLLDTALKNMSQGLCMFDAEPAPRHRQQPVCADVWPDARAGEARNDAAPDPGLPHRYRRLHRQRA